MIRFSERSEDDRGFNPTARLLFGVRPPWGTEVGRGGFRVGMAGLSGGMMKKTGQHH